jgi:hypothetical protein
MRRRVPEREEGVSVLWYQSFGFLRSAALCALHHRTRVKDCDNLKNLPLPSNHRPPQPDKPNETAINCDTGGCRTTSRALGSQATASPCRCCTEGTESGCFASGSGSCGMNSLRKTSSARFFLMCGVRLANSKADPRFHLTLAITRFKALFALRRRKDVEIGR